MRCANCGGFSFKILCNNCVLHLKNSSLKTRILEDEFKVYSFFDYSEIKNLIHSKHRFYGGFVYKSLAKFSFKKMAENFDFNQPVCVVPIDDRVTHGYSHTAILAREMRGANFRPLYRCLHAKSNVSYAGKDFAFRLKNPRNFELLRRPPYPVILIDDIITTGTTMLEARDTLAKAGCEVLFGLVLADAKY